MFKHRVLVFIPLALALGLAACDRADDATVGMEAGAGQGAGKTVLTAEQQASFLKEAIAIKARSPMGEAYRREMEGLYSRFRLPVPKAEAATSLPDLAGIAGETHEAGALAKGVKMIYWKRVKNMDITYPFALYVYFNVAPGQTMTAWTEALSAGVDPMMMAFEYAYDPNGDKITVLALNDDGNGNLQPKITWKNTSADNSITVELMVFAYDNLGRGEARLKYKASAGGVVKTLAGPVHATRQFSNLPVNTENCTGPYSTRIGIQQLADRTYGTSVIAVDVAAKKGGFVREIGVLDLGFVLKPVNMNFVMPFMHVTEGITYDLNHHAGWQDDKYTCIVDLQ